MHIESLSVANFRGIRDLSLTLEPGLTTLVGENNTGKSSVGMALLRVLSAGARGNNTLETADRHYGSMAAFEIDVGCRLSNEEIRELILALIIPEEITEDRRSVLAQWLPGRDKLVHLIFRNHGVELEWGHLRSFESNIGLRTTGNSGDWATYVSSGPALYT